MGGLPPLQVNTPRLPAIGTGSATQAVDGLTSTALSVGAHPTRSHEAAQQMGANSGTGIVKNFVSEVGDQLMRNSTATQEARVLTPGSGYRDYSQLFGLKEGEGLRANQAALSPSGIRDSIQREKLTPGSYLKRVVWGANVQDIKNIRSETGTALGRIAGVGLLGFDIAKNTKTGYQAAQAKHDDGTTMGKVKTYADTAKTFAVEAAKGAVIWEVGSLAFHVGKSLLPLTPIGKFALPALPIAGVLIGAAAATVASRGLDKLAPDPQKPKPNPFAGAGETRSTISS